MNNLKIYHWLIIGFVGMVIVGLGVSFTTERSKNKSIQGTQNQIITPKVESPTTEVKKDEPKTEEPAKEETKTPVKETVAEPKYQPEPTKVLTCDNDQKKLFTSKFGVGYNEARSELLDKMKPDNTAAEDKAAMDENMTKVEYLYRQYLQDMKSINCSAEPLVGGLIQG